MLNIVWLRDTFFLLFCQIKFFFKTSVDLFLKCVFWRYHLFDISRTDCHFQFFLRIQSLSFHVSMIKYKNLGQFVYFFASKKTNFLSGYFPNLNHFQFFKIGIEFAKQRYKIQRNVYSFRKGELKDYYLPLQIPQATSKRFICERLKSPELSSAKTGQKVSIMHAKKKQQGLREVFQNPCQVVKWAVVHTILMHLAMIQENSIFAVEDRHYPTKANRNYPAMS